MKKTLLIFVFLLFPVFTIAQEIGELAPPKKSEVFPKNSWGIDLMFSDGGFGFGSFLRRDIGNSLTGFVDLSISEAKDEREFEYVDYWGQSYVVGKKNRIFLIPINFGLQYRLFSDDISDNLRPYINAGVGPTFTASTPYTMEFFDSFKKAHGKWAAGSYVGLGANFGLDKKNLVGVNIRYYFVHFFDKGVESLENRFKKDYGGVYLAINIGIMY